MAGLHIDVDRARADTPACEHLIHFNNAGSSLSPLPVIHAVTEHLALEQTIGGYEAEAEASDALASFYTEFAALLGCSPDEIAYVENATRAWDMAFHALPLVEGDRLLTHASEYASNYLALLAQARRRGLRIDLVPSDSTGQVDVEAMRRMVHPRTRAILLTHVPTQGGLVNPAEEVGRVAREYGLIYMLDACQSVGQMPVDVNAIGCDILSGTGRKFLRGPRGTGFLYVSRPLIDQMDPPFIDLHSATWTGPNNYELAKGARRFENYESYVAGRIGLARAVSYARALGLDAVEARVAKLANLLRQSLAEIPGVSLHDQGARKCAIVTFCNADEEPTATALRLRQQGINVSVSKRAYAQIDFGARRLEEVVRASVHYFNIDEEIERFAGAVRSD
jgi:selenocysteine lyase/cysteine desulfurase